MSDTRTLVRANGHVSQIVDRNNEHRADTGIDPVELKRMGEQRVARFNLGLLKGFGILQKLNKEKSVQRERA
ncbi:MAG: hypothetical protein ACHQUA_00475 [Microgenomates group bacterium]